MVGTSLSRRLRREGITDLTTSRTTRAAYSSDASLYRQVPTVVVFPRSEEDVLATVAVARASGVPITARGSGTSVAGNAVGSGIVLDFRRHLGAVLELDPTTRTARVQPGVVHATLQRQAGAHGLRFGPDPSTHTRCTIGGMIGNDACGARSLGYGRTADNVEALRVVTGTGQVLSTERVPTPQHVGFDAGLDALRGVVGTHLSALRTELGRFDRQISGYPLHHLLPEHGFDLTRALVGTEGTLALVTEARVRLVTEPAHRLMVVLGYPDMASAADAVPGLLPFALSACEGLDSRLVDVVRSLPGDSRVPPLPNGRAWMMVEVAGDELGELQERARRLLAAADCLDGRIVADPRQAAALWRIREDGAGLAGRGLAGKPAWAGWEDAAVPPAALGAYLRDFEVLLAEVGLTAMPFGHFGEGCLHVRLDFELGDRPGRRAFRDFLERAATLVVSHGGSLSGEHGDGRARSELLARMYSPMARRAFADVKRVFDPEGILNPGIIVDPATLDADLRNEAAARAVRNPIRTLPFGEKDFGTAVHACTGVGKCTSVTQGSGTVMCPSYAATQDEVHSTRGRARVLQELVAGEFLAGWRDPAVHEALDLCLSCKGCASDCPTGTDMAAYKAEVLHQRYRRRLRPRSHYTLGWLPRWAALAARAPRLANALISAPLTRRLALFGSGVDARRGVPRFAERTARQRWEPSRGGGRPAVLFLDSFTDHFDPEVAEATARVLRAAGYDPRLSDPGACCGLTWISTGQLDGARARLQRTVALLLPAARAGVPIIGIEPSCTAALRQDAVHLLGTAEAREVAGAVRTLAEVLLDTPDWTPPDLSGVRAVAQPHCHHHAVMGWDADAALLAATGAEVVRVGGCCGLAGNFGVERGHYETSVKVAELQLLPALAELGEDGIVLADGFSCRTQVADLTQRQGEHLAVLLARRL